MRILTGGLYNGALIIRFSHEKIDKIGHKWNRIWLKVLEKIFRQMSQKSEKPATSLMKHQKKLQTNYF